jgi:hypothetical protein
MRIDKLKKLFEESEGVLEIKNYPTLCEILEINKTGGDSKKAQLKELATLCRFDQHGQKFIIKEIYDKQKEKIDMRGKSEGSHGNNKSVYGDDIMNTLLYFCVTLADKNNLYAENKDDFIITTSNHDLMCEIGIRNRHNTYIANVQPNNFCNQLNLNRTEFDFIKNKIVTNSYNAIKNTIKKVVKSGLAVKTDAMKVVKYHRNDDGTFDKRIVLFNRCATEEELIEISHIKRKVLTIMGCKNEGEIHSSCRPEKRAEFYSRVNKLTYEKLGVSEHYPMIKLHMRKSNIDQYLQKFDNITLDELICAGNEKFLKQQNKTLKSSRTKYLNGKPSKSKIAYVQKFETYENDSDNITHHLINIFADKLELLESDLKVDHVNGEFIFDEEHNYFKDNEDFLKYLGRNPLLIDIIE